MKIQYQDADLVVFESALFRTTCSLIISDDHLFLVDPNWFPIELDSIESFIDQLDFRGEKNLLFTHSDYDHIIGYDKFKSYRTIASQNFVDNNDKQRVLDQIIALDDDNYVKRDHEVIYPKISQAISADKEEHKFGSDNYTFYQARGHNKDGLITYNESKGILVVGDYLSNIEFPYLYDSFDHYKKTLDKLEQIISQSKIKTLVPGHGDITHDEQEMMVRISDSRTYIQVLEQCVKNDIDYDLDSLLSNYDFPQVMTKFHKKNIELLKTEIS